MNAMTIRAVGIEERRDSLLEYLRRLRLPHRKILFVRRRGSYQRGQEQRQANECKRPPAASISPGVTNKKRREKIQGCGPRWVSGGLRPKGRNTGGIVSC